MGRDSYSICEACKVYQDNGYGSYSTWMDACLTLEEFDEKAKDVEYRHYAEYGKNQNVRDFLVSHHGHKITTWNGDSMSYDENEDNPDYRDLEKIEHKHHFGCNCRSVGG